MCWLPRKSQHFLGDRYFISIFLSGKHEYIAYIGEKYGFI